MNKRIDTTPEAASISLIKMALADKAIREHFNLDLETGAKASDREFELEDLSGDLKVISPSEAQAVFRTVPEHQNRINLAAFPNYTVDSYFYDFAIALDALAQAMSETKATNLETLKAALFPEDDIEVAPSTEVTISAAEQVVQLIKGCIVDGKVNVDNAREVVHGHEGLRAYQGQSMAEIVALIVGDKVEVLVSQHAQAVNAIKAFVDEGTEIPEELIGYMLERVPGGTGPNNYDDRKIAQLYLTSNPKTVDTMNRYILILSTQDYERHGSKRETQVEKTLQEHLSDGLAALKAKDLSKGAYLISSDFPLSFMNYLNKHYTKLASFEERVQAFFRDQGRSEALEGFTFEVKNGLEKLSDAEIEAGVEKLKTLIAAIKTQSDLCIGPSDIRSHETLAFLIGKTARIKGSNFTTRLQHFARCTKQGDLLKGITILSNEEDKTRVTDAKHLKTLSELIEADAIKLITDIPEAIIGHLERHYSHIAFTNASRAKAFLEAQGRPDLAAKIETRLAK